MKRIRAINGYAIYEATSARDEANYNCRIGHYNMYIAQDIRDYGLSNSYPDWEDIETLAEVVARANGSQYAVAVALADELSDSTVEDVALRDAIERRLEAGQSIDYIRECYDTDEQCFDPELDWMGDPSDIELAIQIGDDARAAEQEVDISAIAAAIDAADAVLDRGGAADTVLDRGGAQPYQVEYTDGSEEWKRPHYTVWYDGNVFPEDCWKAGAPSIQRDYSSWEKAHDLYEFCEQYDIPVWLKDNDYDCILHRGDWY